MKRRKQDQVEAPKPVDRSRSPYSWMMDVVPQLSDSSANAGIRRFVAGWVFYIDRGRSPNTSDHKGKTQ